MAQVEDNFRDSYRNWHTKVSFAKSGLRILACVIALYLSDNQTHAIWALALGFGLAEMLGIAEEWI